MLVVAALVLAAPATSLAQAVTAPGTDPVSARLAEWARGHALGFVVTAAEEAYYRLEPPQTGGRPSQVPLVGGASSAPVTAAPGAPAVAAVHAPLASLAGAALPGEGLFHVVVSTSTGPAVQVAYLRPDATHTSYLSAVMLLSSRRLRLVQHPGYADPGHPSWWSQPDSLPPAERVGLAATFNGGFKLADARGGYYADGRTVGTLRPGAASLVVYRDGHADVGAWSSRVDMTPDVVSVRQNLDLLVDDNRVAPSAADAAHSTWGATLGGGDFVERSGVGVTADGDLVYVAGAALSAQSLGQLLQHAGAVRAMQLDINPEWVSGMWYSPSADGNPTGTTPHKLLPFARPAARYLSPSSRDFLAAYTR